MHKKLNMTRTQNTSNTATIEALSSKPEITGASPFNKQFSCQQRRIPSIAPAFIWLRKTPLNAANVSGIIFPLAQSKFSS
jgi:hypothetical protein